jgi:hypothetical protein
LPGATAGMTTDEPGSPQALEAGQLLALPL